MTGIERLQGMSMAFRGYTWGASLSEAPGDIAEQIKREHAEDCFGMGERAADVSMSAYDLLPEEEREAIALVRERGGLEAVRAQLDVWQDVFSWAVELGGVETCHEAARWVRERGGLEIVSLDLAEGRAFGGVVDDVAARLGVSVAGLDSQDARDRIMSALDRRLMPEGMEWLAKAWPRFEDGELVRPGDRLLDGYGDWFEAVSFAFTCDWWSIRGYQTEGFGDLNDKTLRSLEGMAYGTRVKRPAPKVLDADGAEIRVGDVLYSVETGGSVTVDSIEPGNPWFATTDGTLQHCAKFTHRAPVIAADGKPLREGGARLARRDRH